MAPRRRTTRDKAKPTAETCLDNNSNDLPPVSHIPSLQGARQLVSPPTSSQPPVLSSSPVRPFPATVARIQQVERSRNQAQQSKAASSSSKVDEKPAEAEEIDPDPPATQPERTDNTTSGPLTVHEKIQFLKISCKHRSKLLQCPVWGKNVEDNFWIAVKEEFSTKIRPNSKLSGAGIKEANNKICRNRRGRTKGMVPPRRRSQLSDLDTWIDRWVRVWKCRDLIINVQKTKDSFRETIGEGRLWRNFSHRIEGDELPEDIGPLIFSPPVWDAYKKHVATVGGKWQGGRHRSLVPDESDSAGTDDDSGDEVMMESAAGNQNPLPSIEQVGNIAACSAGMPSTPESEPAGSDLETLSPETKRKLQDFEERAIALLREAKQNGMGKDVSLVDLVQSGSNKELLPSLMHSSLGEGDTSQATLSQKQPKEYETKSHGNQSPSTFLPTLRPLSDFMGALPGPAACPAEANEIPVLELLQDAARISCDEVGETVVAAPASVVAHTSDADRLHHGSQGKTDGKKAKTKGKGKGKGKRVKSSHHCDSAPPDSNYATLIALASGASGAPAKKLSPKIDTDATGKLLQQAPSKNTSHVTNLPERGTPALLRDFNEKEARRRQGPLVPQRIPYRSSPLPQQASPGIPLARPSKNEIVPPKFYGTSSGRATVAEHLESSTDLQLRATSTNGARVGSFDDPSRSPYLLVPRASTPAGDAGYEFSEDESFPDIEELRKRLAKASDPAPRSRSKKRKRHISVHQSSLNPDPQHGTTAAASMPTEADFSIADGHSIKRRRQSPSPNPFVTPMRGTPDHLTLSPATSGLFVSSGSRSSGHQRTSGWNRGAERRHWGQDHSGRGEKFRRGMTTDTTAFEESSPNKKYRILRGENKELHEQVSQLQSQLELVLQKIA